MWKKKYISQEQTENETISTDKQSRLDKIQQRISQLERQKKAIQARENEKRRKERTRRLIQIGAIAIKYLDCENDIEPAEFEEKIKSLIQIGAMKNSPS